MKHIMGRELESIGESHEDLTQVNAWLKSHGGWNLYRVDRRGWRLFRVCPPDVAASTETLWMGLGLVEEFFNEPISFMKRHQLSIQ